MTWIIEPQTGFEGNGRFTPKVAQILRQAGWCEGRTLTDSEMERWYAFKYKHALGHYQINPSALDVLQEFGGLFVEQDAPGITCYRESFWIDPLMAVGLKDREWGVCEWLIEESLFPLGVTGSSQDDVIAISSSGKVFFVPNEGGLLLVGTNFAQALNCLIVGRMALCLYFKDEDYERAKAAQIQAVVRRIYSSE